MGCQLAGLRTFVLSNILWRTINNQIWWGRNTSLGLVSIKTLLHSSQIFSLTHKSDIKEEDMRNGYLGHREWYDYLRTE